MTVAKSKSRVILAVEALQRFDRAGAVALLSEEIRAGPATGNQWRSVAKLAATIGEIDLALEASRRHSHTEPVTLERRLQYWGDLATFGRAEVARADIARLPQAGRSHPSILHFLASLSGESGDFAGAEHLYRQAIARMPNLLQSWFALAMIKSFRPGDPDLEAMERLRPHMASADKNTQARYIYALAKAWHDIGDPDRAFALYAQGAALRRQTERYPSERVEAFVEGLMRDFTLESMAGLMPAELVDERIMFVNGLPRSGTTLVEQILASHSGVADGGEVNLLRAALIPTGDYSYAGAMAYQRRMEGTSDPWGAVAQDYRRMIAMRFGNTGRIVDKTLSQSHYMGLLIHSMPRAKILWLRRNPEDVALSCFRSYFTSAIPWSWSLEDIAHFMRMDDRLHAHWTALFPDRILTISYEELARDPTTWIERMLTHVDLPAENGVHAFHQNRRSVRTASVQQVRAPISTNRIGLSEGYACHLEPFRRAYFG